MKTHYSRYTPEVVSSITGIPVEQFNKVATLVGQMGKPDKVMTIVYAVGLTHHTTGGQLIRSGAVLQLLLGNIGKPGGGMNAERGHANIQGNTDHAISWELLPGYMRIPAPGQKTIDDYVAASAAKKSDPNSWNFFGTNYRKFMVSLLKAWYGPAATKDNEFAFDYVPKPGQNASWMSIYDQALKGKMEGVILSGMTASSIGPDTNQVQQALSNLKWLVVMDPLPTTSSEFWRAPGVDPAQVKTEVFMLPATHWIEKDGSFTNSGRWAQWKDQVVPPQGQARHDHWILAEVFNRVKNLYQAQGGKFPDPIMKLTLDYKDPLKPELDEIAKEINGKDLAAGTQMTSFANLKDDGTTTAGDWIYTGSYLDSGNLMKRRAGIQDSKTNDPTGMGFYPNWAWSWPLNRRVLYNRASADLDGKPWDPSRPGISWNGTRWVGDVPDYPATMNPHDPNAYLPFIMNGEGVGRLFSNGMIDGPFPEHYEPVESPVANPLHAAVSASPVAFLYDQAAGRPNRFGTAAVTLTVRDGAFGSSNMTFNVTVNPTNDAPTISTILDKVIDEDTSTGIIPFTVNDVETLNELFSTGVVGLLGDVSMVFGIAVIMLWLDWKLALVCLAAFPAILYISRFYRRRAREVYRESRLILGRLNAGLQENIAGVATIQAFAQEEKMYRRFQEVNLSYRDVLLRSIRYNAVFFPVIEIFSALSIGLLLWYGGQQILSSAVQAGVIVAFIQYIQRMYQPIRDLAEKYNIMQAAMASAERIFALLDTPETLKNPARAKAAERRCRADDLIVPAGVCRGRPTRPTRSVHVRVKDERREHERLGKWVREDARSHVRSLGPAECHRAKTA